MVESMRKKDEEMERLEDKRGLTRRWKRTGEKIKQEKGIELRERKRWRIYKRRDGETRQQEEIYKKVKSKGSKLEQEKGI